MTKKATKLADNQQEFTAAAGQRMAAYAKQWGASAADVRKAFLAAFDAAATKAG